MRKNLFRLIFFISIMFFFGCYPTLRKEAQKPEEALIPIRLLPPNFFDDTDLGTLAGAIRRNLQYLNRLKPDFVFRYGPHKFTCQQVRDSQEAFLKLILNNPTPDALNKEIRKNYFIYRAAGRTGNRHVLFTGYFEPIYEGSLKQDSNYKYPVYQIPHDLIRIDLSQFKKEFSGKSIMARIDGNKIIPYYSRRQIETEKVLQGRNLEVAWLKNPLDVAFLHIQGSGRIKLSDGRIISIGYRASNGRSYRSIGRYMLDNGLMRKDEMSMQGIRRYLLKHTEIMDEVLNHNPSYVFFRARGNGPFGNINVPLTPGRSLALNSRLFPKGALCFISTRKPVINNKGEISGWKDFSRFALNQDTGGAITGSGRADIFWGSDKFAEIAAGHMQHEGDLYILIKKP